MRDCKPYAAAQNEADEILKFETISGRQARASFADPQYEVVAGIQRAGAA
ncbi:MAG: hypothetical protein ACLVCW_01920 [Campylobacter sp.]|nr:hypothetical protein [uncultured Campylobacter sp.]